MRKQQIIRKKIWKLNENRTRVRLEKRVKKKLVSTSKDDVLEAYDEVRGKKKSRRD